MLVCRWLIPVLLLLLAAPCPAQPTGGDTRPDSNTPTPTAEPAKAAVRVLMLNSYHDGLEWTDNMVSGLRDALKARRPDALLHIEYMDSKRFWDGVRGTHARQLAERYRTKYSDRQPDVIVSTDDNAFQFLLTWRNELFPGVPVAFCGVNNFEDAMVADANGITGVVEKLDQKATIDLALQIYPQAKRVAIVTDTSATGISNREFLEKLAREYQDRAPFVFLDKTGQGITLKQLLARLRELPPDSVVLYMDFFREGSGEFLDPAEVMPRVSQASPAPVFSMGSHYLGKGIVGGKITRSYDQAFVATQMACDMLDGTPASEIPILREGANRYAFDYRQLQRFGIPLSALPADSIVEHRPFSFYETYKHLVWVTTGVITVLLILLIAMAVIARTRRRAERSLRSLMEGVPDAVFVHNRDGAILFVNQVACQRMGYSRSELLSMNTKDIDAPEFADAYPDRIERQFREGRYACEGEHITRDGQRIPVDINTSVIQFRKQPAILSVARDIRGRREAQRALQESERRLREAQEIAKLGRWELDHDTGRLWWSETIYRMLGLDPDTTDPLYETFLSLVHPEDRTWVDRAFRDSVAKRKPYDVIHRMKLPDGTILYAREVCRTEYDAQGKPVLSVGTVQDVTESHRAKELARESEARYRQLFDTMLDGFALHEVICDDQGRPIDYRFLEVNPAFERMTGLNAEDLIGRTVREVIPNVETRWIERLGSVAITGEPITFEDHVEALGKWYEVSAYSPQQGQFAVVGVDVTERKRAEMERRDMQERLQHTQKLESLGVLAGGIAHDFNNLLVGILGHADLGLSDVSSVSPVRKSLEEIKKAAVRASELTNQMLAYSGKGRFVTKAIDLNELVQEMTHLLEVSISKKIVLKFDLADQLPSVEVDTTQMRQVVMNLITNASDAIENKSGWITVSTEAVQLNKDDLRSTYLADDLPEGYYVVLEVADSGCGMSEETMARIFDPFFTTKFAGRGLGLAALQGIVRGHGGTIKVYSELGKGTTFRVLLPCSDKAVERLEESAPALQEPWKGEGTILVVDDEPSVRTVARMMLERKGFDVLAAADGQEALEVFSQRDDGVDLVLLDMTMPRMSGQETFRQLRRIRSDLPVLLTSGYNEQDAISRFAGKGLAGFIQKPFQHDLLIEKIRGILDPA